MRKSTQRKLKAQFLAATGKLPGGVQIVGTLKGGNIAYVPSAWRRLKKSYLKER